MLFCLGHRPGAWESDAQVHSRCCESCRTLLENKIKNGIRDTPVTFSELCTSTKMRDVKVGMGQNQSCCHESVVVSIEDHRPAVFGCDEVFENP
jgi:hypothetical protein